MRSVHPPEETAEIPAPCSRDAAWDWESFWALTADAAAKSRIAENYIYHG